MISLISVAFPVLLNAAIETSETSQQDLELLAQWSLNHGSYLIDVGKYLEALEAFDTSYESSTSETTKVRALLHRAMTLAVFLDAPEDALRIYRRIQKHYPDHAETGRYRESLLLFDLERYRQAVAILEAYLRAYPSGRYRFQAEALLDQARINVRALSPKPEKRKVPIKKRPKPEEKRVVEVPTVRVLLYRKAKEVQLQGKGLQLIRENGVLWKGTKAKLKIRDGQIAMSATARIDGDAQFQAQGPIVVSVGKHSKKVRGDLLITALDKGLRVSNHIDIEAYLRGVVPSESYPTWPAETLKAQAVAARTYVLYQVRHRTKRAYDVVDHEGDQAYKGVDKEHPRTDEAVESTKGEVLIKPMVTKKMQPILAMYSANSGGHTADAKAIFRVDNSILRAQPDPWSLDGQMAKWTRRFSRTHIERALAKVGVKVHQLQAFEPVTVGPSGRLIRVRLIHKGKPITIRSRPVLTRALKLPEILIEIQKKGNEFAFNGRGWGHGVGYSQWGGAGMAKQGKSYHEILAYYYAGAVLQRLW